MFHLEQTWWQVHLVKLLCSQCNFILGSDRQMFKTVGIQDLRTFHLTCLPSLMDFYNGLPRVIADTSGGQQAFSIRLL